MSVLAFLGACSFASIDGLSDGTGTRTEGDADRAPESDAPDVIDVADVPDVPDAAVDATDARDQDASDAADACVNLLLNPGFEQQTACSPWNNSGGGLAVDGTPARSGANACRACTPPSGLINLLTSLLGQTFGPGEVVRFEAWLRAADGALYAKEIGLYMAATTSDAPTAKFMLLSDTYQRITSDFAMPLDGGPSQTPRFQFLLYGAPDAGAPCILMDDVRACRIGDGGQ